MRGGIVAIEVAVGGGNRQLAALRHRIARIGGQIGQAGLELRRIGDGRPEIVGEIERDLDVFPQSSPQQPNDAGDQLVRRDALGAQRLLAGEGEQPAGQLGAAQRSFDRFLHQLDDLVVVFDQRPGEIEVAQDHSQHVVEIVRHPAGQIADRLHLLRLAQLFFGADAHADVADRRGDQDAFGTFQRAQHQFDRKLAR
jgi:hypothetical protein